MVALEPAPTIEEYPTALPSCRARSPKTPSSRRSLTGRSAGSTRATSSKPRTVASIASRSWSISQASLTSRSSPRKVASSCSRPPSPTWRTSRVDARVDAAQDPGPAGCGVVQRLRKIVQVLRCACPAPRTSRRACAGGRSTARRRRGRGRTRRCRGASGGGRRGWPRRPRSITQDRVGVVLTGQVDEVRVRAERVVGVVRPYPLGSGGDDHRLAGEGRGHRRPPRGVIGRLRKGRYR